jgi:hypothetical protein
MQVGLVDSELQTGGILYNIQIYNIALKNRMIFFEELQSLFPVIAMRIIKG